MWMEFCFYDNVNQVNNSTDYVACFTIGCIIIAFEIIMLLGMISVNYFWRKWYVLYILRLNEYTFRFLTSLLIGQFYLCGLLYN
jgi:hypothetical protein